MTTLMELINERTAAAERQFEIDCQELLDRHGATSLWDVPADERHELINGFAEALRVAWYRDPIHADATPERHALERAGRRAAQTSGESNEDGAPSTSPGDLLAEAG